MGEFCDLRVTVKGMRPCVVSLLAWQPGLTRTWSRAAECLARLPLEKLNKSHTFPALLSPGWMGKYQKLSAGEVKGEAPPPVP